MRFQEQLPQVPRRREQTPHPPPSPPEETLLKLLEEKQQKAIDPRDFRDLYRDTAEDIARVERLEAENARRETTTEAKATRRRSRLFELIVSTQIEESDWFGPTARVITPSRYDDIENHIDSVVEFEEQAGRSHLALAFDVTKSDQHVREKFADIRGSIESGKLSRMKYFKSHGYRGELSRVPRIVAGADQKTVSDVVQLLLEFKTNRSPQNFPRLRERLGDHSLQYQLLFEAKIQLETFLKYAEKLRQTKCADAYRRVLTIIDGLIGEKTRGKDVHTIVGSINRDEVFRMIAKEVENFDARK